MSSFQFKNKTILLISPEPWNHIFVSKHHYAIELAKRGNKVFFLNPPCEKYKVQSTKYKNLSIVDYRGFIKGMTYLPLFIRKWIQKIVFNKIQRACNVEIDIIWSFDNSVFYDFDFLPQHVLKISHIVDLNMAFQLQRATTSADICFCTTGYIHDKLLTHNKNTFKINHGVASQNNISTIKLAGANEYKSIYIGNLSMKYLDWKILLNAVKRFQNIDFIFIGPGADDFDLDKNAQHVEKQLVHKNDNAYFLEKIEANQIESYLASANLLLIAYQEKHHKDQANPHKVMEYLASGKPIVATYTEEYDKFDLIQMSKSNNEWIDVFENTINQLSKLSTTENCNKRISFAANNTYENQLMKIEELIEKVSTSAKK